MKIQMFILQPVTAGGEDPYLDHDAAINRATLWITALCLLSCTSLDPLPANFGSAFDPDPDIICHETGSRCR
jgi:hypothetical protein